MSDITEINKCNSPQTVDLQKEEEAEYPEQQFPFPEGGIQAWLVVVAAWFIMAMTFGVINAFGVYETYYVSRYEGLSTSSLSVAGSIAPTMICLSSLPAIMVMQLLGARITAFIGTLIIVVSFMLLSLINASWQIYLVQGILFGIGSGLSYVLCAQVVFQWFSKKKSLAFGIVSSGSSIGGIYWPIIARKMIEKVNFGWSCRTIGFIMLPMVVCILLFFKENPKFLKFQAMKKNSEKTAEESTPIKKKFRKVSIDVTVLKDWRFALIVLSNVFAYFSLFPCMFYLDLYVNKLPGIDSKIKQFNVPILNAGSVIGRVLPGYLGDKIGTLNTLIPFLLMTGVLQLALWIPMRSDAAVICFSVFGGIASGVIVSMFPTCIGHLFPIANLHSYLAIFFAFSSIGSMLGPVLGGLLLSGDTSDSVMFKDFRNLGIFCGIFSIAGTALLIIIRISKSRKLYYRI